MIKKEDIRRLVFRTGLSVMKVSLKNLVMTALTCSLMGCASLNFYTQAVTGQVQLLLDRQPIDIVLAERGGGIALLENRASK